MYENLSAALEQSIPETSRPVTTEDIGQEETMDEHLKSSTLTNSTSNLFNNAKINKQKKLPPIEVVMRNGAMGQ